MPPEELTLILKLRDEATKQLKSVRGTVTAVGTAMATVGLKVGADWAAATKTIVDGTGATGAPLQQLQADFQAVAHLGADVAATAIADLNTFLGLTGPELQDVSAQALKAGIDTAKFGAVAKQAGLDVNGYKKLLDDLTVASQATGVSTDQLLDTIGKNSARWLAGGGDISGLTAHVVALADEFGPTGLRGAMSETMTEVDQGVLPAFESLETQLGDTTGAVETTYLAGRTWRDVLGEMKDGAVAYAGPAGDMLAGVGSLGVALVTMGPHLLTVATNTGLVSVAQKALNLVMSLNPIGLVITAIGALVAVYLIWKTEINNFLTLGWNLFITAIESGINVLRPLASLIGIDLPADLGKYKFATGEAETATTDATAEIALLKDEATAAAPAIDLATVATGELKTSAEDLVTPLESATALVKELTDAEKLNETQAKASATAMDLFVTSIDSIMTPAPVAIEVEFPLAGDMQGGLDMVVGLMEPPASVRDVLGPTMGQDLVDGLESIFSPENIGATFSRAFEGGGGAVGAICSLATQAKTALTAGFATALDTIVPGLGRIAGPLLAGAEALGRAIGEKIWDILGGPSKEVVAARGDLDAFASEVEGHVGQTASSTERLQDFLDHGWEQNRATIITYFQDQALAAGKSASDGTAHWLAYQAAVEAGNSALAADLAQQAIDWADTNATAATDSEEAWAASYTAQTVTNTAMTDEAIANSGRLKDAVVADTVLILASWVLMASGMESAWDTSIAAIKASLGSIEDKTITITTVHKSVGGTGGGGIASPFGGGSSQTQSQGPATTGPITVVVPQDAVTDAVLRAAPGREALRGWA